MNRESDCHCVCRQIAQEFGRDLEHDDEINGGNMLELIAELWPKIKAVLIRAGHSRQLLAEIEREPGDE